MLGKAVGFMLDFVCANFLDDFPCDGLWLILASLEQLVGRKTWKFILQHIDCDFIFNITEGLKLSNFFCLLQSYCNVLELLIRFWLP